MLQRYAIRDAVVPLHSQEASAFHVLGWRVDCYDRVSDSVVMSVQPRSADLPELLTAPASAPACGG